MVLLFFFFFLSTVVLHHSVHVLVPGKNSLFFFQVLLSCISPERKNSKTLRKDNNSNNEIGLLRSAILFSSPNEPPRVKTNLMLAVTVVR